MIQLVQTLETHRQGGTYVFLLDKFLQEVLKTANQITLETSN